MQNKSGVPITIVKGTDFYLPILYITKVGSFKYPVNITGYTIQMQVRPTVGSTGTPLVNISTALGTIIVDGPNGKIELTIPKSVTVNLPVGTFVYDCLVTNVKGWTEELLFGNIVIKERTTK